MTVKDSGNWQALSPGCYHRATIRACEYVAVLQASLPLLRRLGGSFFVGLVLGLIWALLIIHQRPPRSEGDA
jgi:protein-S-isoprenylcysteine O-methyltransferase Ste14